jgi:uncharacterized protein (AIM24 family)
MIRRLRWAKLSNKGLIFLQAGSSIVEKRLGVGEEIQVNHSCLFAYSSNIKLSKANVQLSISNTLLKDWLPLKCKGPGVVFIESPGAVSVRQHRAAEIWLFILVLFMFTLIGAILPEV